MVFSIQRHTILLNVQPNNPTTGDTTKDNRIPYIHGHIVIANQSHAGSKVAIDPWFPFCSPSNVGIILWDSRRRTTWWRLGGVEDTSTSVLKRITARHFVDWQCLHAAANTQWTAPSYLAAASSYQWGPVINGLTSRKCTKSSTRATQSTWCWQPCYSDERSRNWTWHLASMITIS